MKTAIRLSILLFIAILCACNTTELISLNTLRPAQADYHHSQPHVVVMNNSFVPDATHAGRYIDENGKQYRLSYPTDSLPKFSTLTLATHLYESNFFEQVDVLLPDSNHITGIDGITPNMIEEWQSSYPDDVYIAINAIQPQASMYVQPFQGYFGIEFRLVTSIQLQYYVPGKPLESLAVNDTLLWYGYGETPELAQMELPEIEMCLDEAASSITAKAAQHFTPYEHTVRRFIFTTAHPAMKDANRYWQQEQYDEASYIWEYVYENAKDKGRKGKAAANLALYHELQDDYTQALKYAQQAQAIFMEINYIAESEYMSHYSTDLQNRIGENELLKKQFDKRP